VTAAAAASPSPLP
jgi:serine palmitoyltransferase